MNNAVYATYFEEARLGYVAEVLDVHTDESGLVVAHLELDYRRPVTEDDHVMVALRTGELGRSSIPMEYEIRVGDDVVATGETVMVTSTTTPARRDRYPRSGASGSGHTNGSDWKRAALLRHPT